jgi:soluble lytic murein transglycosylase-like protein
MLRDGRQSVPGSEREYVRWLSVLSVLLSALLPAAAGPAVLFEDGRAMRVESAVREDSWARLVLEGGGEISVPAERIVNWEELVRWSASGLSGSEPDETEADTRDPAWRSTAGPYAELIAVMAERHALDPALLTSMVQVESAFDPLAVSPQGACGLLQLMPHTADRFGVSDVFDATQNVEAGARYLSWLLERYSGRTDLALAGYNAGEGAVDRHSGIPPYRETRQYVERVLVGAAGLAP